MTQSIYTHNVQPKEKWKKKRKKNPSQEAKKRMAKLMLFPLQSPD